MTEPVRPRYGYVTNGDTNRLVVFHPTPDPDVFTAVWADDETPAVVGDGDQLHVDCLGPHQSVTFVRHAS